MFNNRNGKFLLYGVPIFLGAIMLFNIRGCTELKSYEFKGVVQNVEYDIQGSPDVFVNGRKYSLGYNGWNFGYNIQKGDSLIKDKGTMTVKLIKFKTCKVIIFK